MTDDRVEAALRRLLDEARAEVQWLHFDCRVYAEKLEAAEAAVERLEQEWQAIQNDERVLTCVYCGHEYPPGTPASNHAALTAHVAVCEQHPAAAFRARAEAAEARLCTVVEALTQAEIILSDGDYGEDVAWREARDRAQAALRLADGAVEEEPR